MDFNMFLFVLAGALVIILNIFAIFWFGGMLIPIISFGGPYVPSSNERVRRMLKMAEITTNDIVVDLGSGDGRLLIGALEQGAQYAIGYEIHPGLAKYARTKLARKGMTDRSTVFHKSMWKADLSNVTLVLLYQIPYAMEKLGDKLLSELPSGARVVSNAFTFPNWKPIKDEADIHVYIKK
jgi:phospholipid N-methyltransferase